MCDGSSSTELSTERVSVRAIIGERVGVSWEAPGEHCFYIGTEG